MERLKEEMVAKNKEAKDSIDFETRCGINRLYQERNSFQSEK